MFDHRVAAGFQSLNTVGRRRATAEWDPAERVWRTTFASDKNEALPETMTFSLEGRQGDESTRWHEARDEAEDMAGRWVRYEMDA